MGARSLRLANWVLHLSIASFVFAGRLCATPEWGPNPPVAITGATAGIDAGNNVVTAYDASNQTVIAAWMNAGFVPYYAIWGGFSWIVPASAIPLAGTPAVSQDMSLAYDSANHQVLAVWAGSPSSGSLGTATYAIWNGTDWNAPAVITGAASGDAEAAGFVATYDPNTQTILTTWLDGTGTPTYAAWNGSSWTSAATIPGAGNAAEASPVAAYDVATQTMIVVWIGVGGRPTYAIWQGGTTWTTGATQIPSGGAGTTNPAIVYDAANDTAVMTWLDKGPAPRYAIWNGSSWAVRDCAKITYRTGEMV